jgi:short-subunit dehydrogenase
MRTKGILLAAAAGFGFGITLASKHRKRISFRGRTVVITGGSRGLGFAMARKFAREGARLALLARDTDELDRAKIALQNLGADVLTISCDLREQEEVERAIHRILEYFGRIDVLINNAGVIQVGPMEHMSVADFEDAMAVHFFAPLFTTLATIPHMRRAREGRIVNIASIGGKIAVPHLLPYCASKFALVGFSDGLRAELRRHHIFVTTVCPGLMRTGSTRNALFKGNHRREHAWFSLSASLPAFSMNADRAAIKIIEACRRGSPHLVLGVQAKAATLANELFPNSSARLLAAANRVLPNPDGNSGRESYAGYESQSKWISWLTRLNRRAARKNNQMPAPAM